MRGLITVQFTKGVVGTLKRRKGVFNKSDIVILGKTAKLVGEGMAFVKLEEKVNEGV